MGNATATADNALGNATSANGMTNTTSVAPTARHVQFHGQPVQRLAWAFKALNIGRIEDCNSKPKESVDLGFHHGAELLCSTTEISMNLGLLKMLKDAIARRDTDKWREAIANEIGNFLKRNAWKKVPMRKVSKMVQSDTRLKL